MSLVLATRPLVLKPVPRLSTDDLASYIGKQKHRYNIVYNSRRWGELHHTNRFNNQSLLKYVQRKTLFTPGRSHPTLIFRDLQASQPYDIYISGDLGLGRKIHDWQLPRYLLSTYQSRLLVPSSVGGTSRKGDRRVQ